MASGRFVPISISKTVSAPDPMIPSTAIPDAVKSSASRRSSTVSSTNSRTHCGESLIASIAPASRRLCHCPLRPLPQEPHVPLKEQLQIVHPILQQSNSIRPHAKGESRNSLRVIPVVLHKLKYIRVDHAASQNLNPPRLLARTAGV